MMEVTKEQILEAIRDWWKPVTIVLLSACLLFVMSAQNAATERRLAEVAVETHTSLCALKDDLERRLESTKEYLQKHPGKEPIEGISRADLRRSLENQKATLNALASLEC